MICSNLDFYQDKETSSVGGPSRHSATLSRIAFLHLLKGSRQFRGRFSARPRSQHFAVRIEDVGDAVGVEHDRSPDSRSTSSVASISTAFGNAPKYHAAGFEQTEVQLRAHDHAGRMPGAGENHSPAAAVQSRSREVKKKTELPILCMTNLFNCRSMLSRAAPRLQLRHRFAVNAIGDERRTDAVAGNIADQQI